MDATRCKETVWAGWRPKQCSRKIWKDGYCKQHHPDSVKEREKKRDERYEAKKAKSPWRLLEKANARIKELEEELEYIKSLGKED
jgi:hypothetical protein